MGAGILEQGNERQFRAEVTRVLPGILFSIEFETDAGRRKIFLRMSNCHLSGDWAPRVCSISGW
jgi:hypothetical protein